MNISYGLKYSDRKAFKDIRGGKWLNKRRGRVEGEEEGRPLSIFYKSFLHTDMAQNGRHFTYP